MSNFLNTSHAWVYKVSIGCKAFQNVPNYVEVNCEIVHKITKKPQLYSPCTEALKVAIAVFNYIAGYIAIGIVKRIIFMILKSKFLI